MNFNNANDAFIYFYNKINFEGEIKNNTKKLNNIGFYISNPLDNLIKAEFRKWKIEYAKYEWDWYLSKNRSVADIKKIAKIWDKMHGGDDLVWSNYGWQWDRNNQLKNVIEILNKDKNTRRAVISIYDGKEIENYKYDTPCTLNIVFSIDNDLLNMTVIMRSNDLWFGFCNDQYCFSKLQELVSKKINKKVGWYYHFANDLHLYKKHLNN
jgi:thymidylate synthase